MIDLHDYHDHELWCGVFQGGGARGAAYAGALESVHARHQWFKAAAGSSAGAITAALVAACLDPAEIRRQTTRLLASVRPAGPLDRAVNALGWKHLVRYDSALLESSLDTLLRHTLRTTDDDDPAPVTFAELHRATGVHLYVIVADASTGVPVPFSVETTPHLPVAGAVIASCSIPVVFAPRYATVDTDDPHSPTIRRLQDGGLWANYPTFVFTDPAFRSYHGLQPLQGQVLGFALMYDTAVPTRVGRLLDVPASQQRTVEALSWPAPDTQRPPSLLARADGLLRRCLLPVIFLLSAVILLLTDATRVELLLPAATLLTMGLVGLGLASWRSVNLVVANVPIAIGGLFAVYALVLLGEPPAPGVRPSIMIIVGLAGLLIAVGLILHRVIDRTAVGLHGMLTIITGQTIKPPPWIDHRPGSHTIYLQTGRLTMLSFDAPEHEVDAAIEAARTSSSQQLHHILMAGSALEHGWSAAGQSAWCSVDQP